MNKTFWTKERLADALKEYKLTGSYTKAAFNVSLLWGDEVSVSSVRHALMYYKDGDILKVRAKKQKDDAAILSDIEPLPDSVILESSFGKMKRREYDSKNMGGLRDYILSGANGKPVDINIQENSGGYVAKLSEDEKRYMNRRSARLLSIGAARDALITRNFKEFAESGLPTEIKASGYALKHVKNFTSRMVNLLLSDLHIGAILNGLDSPHPFGSAEESRRLAHVVLETCDYKTQYRDDTTLNLLINGDVLQGQLQHQLVDGEPLALQQVAFFGYMAKAIAEFAHCFPVIHIYCQTGNHERNKLTHQGRAVEGKFNSFIWGIFHMLESTTKNLKNVIWHIPTQPWSIVPLFEKKMLMTHGDTELKLKSPANGFDSFVKALDNINSRLIYGTRVNVLAVGHFHEAMFKPVGEDLAVVTNGCLLPTDGHARSAGFASTCGQWVWESTNKYAAGDFRFLRVGIEEDKNPELNKVIPEYNYKLARFES